MMRPSQMPKQPEAPPADYLYLDDWMALYLRAIGRGIAGAAYCVFWLLVLVPLFRFIIGALR